VSWLLVAFIPGLLMLAALGLGRLEAGLVENTVTAKDVAEFLAQAEPIDVRTLARDGMPEALDCMHRRIERAAEDSPERSGAGSDGLLASAVISGSGQAGLPGQRPRHSRANRQFGPPQPANRV
jgi:hypothetical protein